MTAQEKSSSTTSSTLAAIYKKAEEQYLSNAIGLWEKNEPRKASEMLWGTVVQSLKAFAASRGITNLYGLSELPDLVRQLAKELNDDTVRTDFRDLRVLHTNFYDEVLAVEDFPTYYAKATAFIDKIDHLPTVKS